MSNMYNEYDEQAKRFLEEAGTEISYRQTGIVQGFPFDRKDKLIHDKYTVTLRRGDKKYTFPFYGSYSAHEKGEKASPYDILACLTSYEIPDDMWDFAEEFGYEIHCREDYEQTLRTWEECRRQYDSLLDLFGPKLMERLAEIQ